MKGINQAFKTIDSSPDSVSHNNTLRTAEQLLEQYHGDGELEYGGALLLAAQIHGEDLTTNELAAELDTTVTELVAEQQRIIEELDLSIDSLSPIKQLDVLAEKLDVSDEVADEAEEIITDYMSEGKHSGKSPAGVAAGAIRVASLRVESTPITQGEACEAANVARPTVKERKIELKTHCDIDVQRSQQQGKKESVQNYGEELVIEDSEGVKHRLDGDSQIDVMVELWELLITEYEVEERLSFPYSLDEWRRTFAAKTEDEYNYNNWRQADTGHFLNAKDSGTQKKKIIDDLVSKCGLVVNMYPKWAVKTKIINN